MQAIGELLKGVDAGRVERRHVAKTQDHHVPKLLVRSLVASASFSVVPKRNGP